MSTCCWCTPGCSDTVDLLLEKYASAAMPPKEFAAANEDLCYCLECVDAYHKARGRKESLHEVLWELETARLITHFQKSMEESGEDDSLFIVEEDREIPFSYFTGAGFESHLRVAFLEILKYPHLLNHPRLSRLFVDALCKLEQIGCSFQVSDKLPGIYLLMVHPNEEIRRWAILTARSLGKLNRDDYYELQEVLTLLFTVIKTGCFENPRSVYNSSALNMLPPHLYDATNYKNYWLGICMLLTVLEEQAMDSLLLGPDKQNDFIQSIIDTMEKNTDDESSDPFWPALHCFMVILDKLGSKVWGEHIDKIKAFEAVTNNSSYKKEISNIRQSCRRTKSEPVLDYGDQSITCSQLVYDFNPEKPSKDTTWRTAICPDYVSSLYEDMQTLTDMFQHDIGEDMKLHNSTFLWFIPFVHSLIDLKECGVAYCQMVIRHLCSEIERGFDCIIGTCDKVSEFLTWILVTVIELHLKKNYLNSLWLCLEFWVKMVIKCAVLPNTAFLHAAERGAARNSSRSSSGTSREPEPVQFACMTLIRNILKEGCKIGQGPICQPFLNELNLLRRNHTHWQLDAQQARDLQSSLEQVVRNMQSKSLKPPSREEIPAINVSPLTFPVKQERKDDRYESSVGSDCLPNFAPGRKDEAGQERPPSRRSSGAGEEVGKVSCKEEDLCRTSKLLASEGIKQVTKSSALGTASPLAPGLAKGQVEARRKESGYQRVEEHNQFDSSYTKPLDRGGPKLDPKLGTLPFLPEKNPSSCPEEKMDLKTLTEKSKPEKPDLTFRLKQLMRRQLSLEPAAEKQESAKNNSKECQKNEISSSRNVKSETSSEDSNLGKPLIIKKKSVDRLAEFKSNLKTEQYSSESSSSSSSSEDDSDNIPLGKIQQKLVRKKMVVSTSLKTDSQVNTDSNQLSLFACAKGIGFPGSNRTGAVHGQSQIKRKVKGAVQSSSVSQSGETVSKADGVITISSDEGEGEVNQPEIKKVNIDACLKKESSEPTREPSTASSNSPVYEECESQLFEFETEDDIFSMWTDSQMDAEVEGKGCMSPEQEAAMEQNGWGYDTDYIADDVVKKAAEDLECQVKKSKADVQSLAPRGSARGGSEAVSTQHSSGVRANAAEGFRRKSSDLPSTSASASPSRSSLISKSTSVPKKKLAESKHYKMANRSPKRKVIKPSVNSKKSPNENPSRSTPAVVPPHKVRHIPEPTSLPVKLGLKKRVRVAADLSQRTQDCVAKLRNYGKAVGELGCPPQRRSKLIRAPSLLRKNKSMLACQERQFYRQAKPKDRETTGGKRPRLKGIKVPEELRPVTSAAVGEQKEGTDHLSSSPIPRKKMRPNSTEKEIPQPLAASSSKERPLNQEKSTVIQGGPPSVALSLGSLCSSTTACGTSDPTSVPGSSSSPRAEDVDPREGDPEGNEDDFDLLFLTQRDPVDMELCSQVEDTDATGVETNVPPSLLSNEIWKQTDRAEKVNGAGRSYQERSVPNPSDHVFAKPFAPPKLSTTKIFSTKSCSRSASLTKDLESVSKAPAASKSKVASSSKGNTLLLRTPTLSSVLRPQNSNNVPQLRGAQSNLTKLPASLGHFGHQLRSGVTPVQQIDPRMFIKMVLKWNYDMLTQPSRFGPPEHLLQSIVAHVPVTFRDYGDYFQTFFPLMMLDAFEKVVQEWLDTQACKVQKPYLLDLLNFNTDKAEFSAIISASDLDKQLHPKEDDLVFLIVSEKRNFYSEEGEMEGHQIHHVGLVTRFSPPSIHDAKKGQQVVCHLSIQTQGNLSRVDKQVKCMVVSSLVSTQRRFRALLLLPRSPLAKAIITPSYGDFCLKDSTVDSENHTSFMNEFNEDQRKAIETAYSLVTQCPSLPQICLIHGPPGTGKSKTILGLLYRILSERSGKENPVQYLNAKIKRNRVLVCAPSNAAVDELMKKIILMFKEKCQDKHSPLGNCGDVNLVRLGQEKSISKEVRKFSLNIQVENRISRTASGKDQDLQKRKGELDRQLDTLSYQRAMYRSENQAKELCNKQLDDEICRLRNERKQLTSQLKELRGRSSQELKWNIILESHIICSTLSTSGGILLESAFRRLGCDPLSCVIVDEAGQSCEIETIIPLIHSCRKLVLVGDPKQLPPTVISMKAQEYGYDQSLMGRLCQYLREHSSDHPGSRLPVLPLMTQYRMHPDICLFPSNYIYNRSLKTDSQVAENRFSSEWPFVPYLLFDVLDGREERENGSYANHKEVKLVMEIMKLIKKKKRIGFRNVGIITPYSAQKKRIMAAMVKEFKENSAGEVDTVDGFQGREKDCIIVTCVRAKSAQGSIGFLKSLQRLNVTLTRARYSLFILGHLQTLMDNGDWNELIQDAQKRWAIVKTRHTKHSGTLSYAEGAQKILKRAMLETRQKAAPIQDSSRASVRVAAASTTVAPGSSGGQGPSVSQNPPGPPLAKPPQERPKDPRLARRADPAKALASCLEGALSSSAALRGEVPPSSNAPPAQRNLSSATQQTLPKKDVSGHPISGLPPCAAHLPAKPPDVPDRPWGIPISADGARDLGKGGHQSPSEWGKDKDYRFSSRRTSEDIQEGPTPLDVKQRRTTY